jgi:hypothetical protein
MRKMSRLEANKEVRRVLNRHGTDLSFAQYSVAGYDIRLTGWLCRIDTSDFNVTQIESIIHDFHRYLPGYTITGDFENWSFTTDHITFLGDRTKGDSENETYFMFDDPVDPESEAS